jgi:flagellum-specific ATP synthase
MLDHRAIALIRTLPSAVRTGRLCRIMPTWLEADGPAVGVGALCQIERFDAEPVTAEVVRVDSTGIALVPHGDTGGLVVGSLVVATSAAARAPVGLEFLGRAVDALGEPIDGGKPIAAEAFVALNPDPPVALGRETPNEMLETGIRAIDGLLTLSRGQRIGVFAASGVGKTSLLNQLQRQVQADACITCLVGERGREVEAMLSRELDPAIRKRLIIVAATSDQAAALRVRAVHQAVALARHLRDQGLHVLFLLDSVTRFAMALRELGLAAGEPPTVRAYTPSVFATIPRMVEQFGALRNGGSISAIMTVLSETDDIDDPLSELMKSLLDGHLMLSRTLAEESHFPAIDALKSVSRNEPSLRSARHRDLARKATRLLATYENARTLIESGLYTAGSNVDIDAAIAARPKLLAVLRQDDFENSTVAEILASLEMAVSPI